MEDPTTPKPKPTKSKPATIQQPRTTLGKADLLKALEQSLGIVTSACRAIGIERKTHYKWLESDPDYAAAVRDVQEQALDYVEQSLFKRVQDMDTTAIIFYLKTKGKARGYVERVQTQEVKAEPFVVERETVTTPDAFTTSTT